MHQTVGYLHQMVTLTKQLPLVIQFSMWCDVFTIYYETEFVNTVYTKSWIKISIFLLEKLATSHANVGLTVSSRGLKTLCKFERCKIFAKILHKSKKKFTQFFTHFAEFFADSFAKIFADFFAKFFAHIFTPFCTYVGTYLDIYDDTYEGTYINVKKFCKMMCKNM